MYSKVQGPFPNHKMLTWFQNGCFFSQLQLRTNWSSEWRTLSAWFPQTELAFQMLVGVEGVCECSRMSPGRRCSGYIPSQNRNKSPNQNPNQIPSKRQNPSRAPSKSPNQNPSKSSNQNPSQNLNQSSNQSPN